ncbi:MAG: hypothetical protein MRY74_08670 [Neomegalonema sp.]|nr:hypothetical protein [Neomegalonema sp.]
MRNVLSNSTALLLAAFLATPAAAQSNGEERPVPGGEPELIEPSERSTDSKRSSRAPAARDETGFDEKSWRAYAGGKTLHYALRGGLVGKEYFQAGTNRVVFELKDGKCFNGTWEMKGDVFCFDYDKRYCFYHVKRGDKVFARSVTDGEEQEVVKITEEKLSCAGDQITRRDTPTTRLRAALAAAGALK